MHITIEIDVDLDSFQNKAQLCQHWPIFDKYQQLMCWSKSSFEHLYILTKKLFFHPMAMELVLLLLSNL